ncbi:MAG TPA: TlpA disulfide reductase family protein [Geobacterales bacterium]|nr:TlpA disulfide reductase family protein [Geobacterales bacterium]
MRFKFAFFTTIILVTFSVATICGCRETQKSESAQLSTPPPFTLNTITGKPVSLAGLQGKVVILDFFATWCPPCQESIPHLVGLQQKYGAKGLQVVGLSVDDDTKGMADFARERKINYPVAVVTPEVRDAYGIASIPHIFILDRQGKVVKTELGFDPAIAKSIDETVEQLLQK